MLLDETGNATSVFLQRSANCHSLHRHDVYIQPLTYDIIVTYFSELTCMLKVLILVMLIIEISGEVWRNLEAVQQCFSAVMRVWSFMDCVLVTLNINEDDDIDMNVMCDLIDLHAMVSCAFYACRGHCHTYMCL